MAVAVGFATRVKHSLTRRLDAWARGRRFKALGQKVQSATAQLKEAHDSRWWPQRPETLTFEITAACDAACIHCPRQDMDRPQKAMDMQLFKKIVDEAADLRIPNLAPNGYGEIMTLRNLEVYLSYIRSRKHRFKIIINSNGYRLTSEKQELLLRYEVDLLNITLDGATAETFEAIRPKLKLAPIEENIKSLLATRRLRKSQYPKVRVGMIALPQNAHEIDMLLEKWRGVADFVGIGGFTNRGGSLDERFHLSRAVSTAHACVLPFRELNVWADGKAVLCCDDWNEEEPVGDANNQTLLEIWHGVELARARKAHIAGNGSDIGICAKCSMWRPPSKYAALWNTEPAELQIRTSGTM